MKNGYGSAAYLTTGVHFLIFFFFLILGIEPYTHEASTLPLTCIPYPLLMLDFEREPHEVVHTGL